LDVSRAEEITSEVRRLVVTCRALEAQLKESIPKKVHNETVAKMQAEIDRLKGELNSVKEELERTRSIGSYLASIESEVKNQSESFSALGRKIEEGTVSNEIYQQSLQRIRELESTIENLRSTTVPREVYSQLETRLQGMVEREALEKAEARIRELEAIVSNSVPKETLEELKARITELVSEALANVAKEAVAAAQAYDSKKNEEMLAEAEKAVAPVEVLDTETQPAADTNASMNIQDSVTPEVTVPDIQSEEPTQ
jgi:HAMP domain-containing protein